jgi:hypothetical protein
MRLSTTLRVIIITMVSLAAPASYAADVDFPAPDSAVSPSSATTYLDLARHFVPDLAPTGGGYVGKTIIPLRHIGGPGYSSGQPEEFGFYDIATVSLHADGKERLLVLFDMAQSTRAPDGVAILALYDAGKQVRLLDAADIGFDQSTYFFDQGLMPVSPTSDVILTMSTHFNSSQAYTTQSMIMVRNDRLQLIDTAFLFNDKLCTAERQQNIRYAANPDAGKPYAPINVFVTETTTPTHGDCGSDPTPPLGTRNFHVTYQWDVTAGKYVRNSDVLEKLAKANEERF